MTKPHEYQRWLMDSNFHIVWNGEISMNSSFGIAACEQIQGFQKLGITVYTLPNQVKVKEEPIPPSILESINLAMETPHRMKGNSVYIHQGFPHYFHNCNVMAKLRTGLGVNDSDEVMGTEIINKSCDIVWAGSEWTRKAYQKAGVTVPAYTFAYGINPDIWGYIERPIKPVFTFLVVSDYTGRKRINELLEAFETEFDNEEPVRIIYKAWGTNVDEVAKRFAHRKNILIYWSETTFKNLREFYEIADCYVLPTSGDSIGMPFLEALATGLPCITTGMGGQTQWCDEKNSWLLDCVPYKSPYLAGNQYMPDFQQLRAYMRAASQSPSACRQKGKIGSEMMHSRYKWIDGCKYAKSIIEEHLEKKNSLS